MSEYELALARIAAFPRRTDDQSAEGSRKRRINANDIEDPKDVVCKFTLAMSINADALDVERKVRRLLALVSHELNEDDEIFKVPDADNSAEDKLRYCTKVLELLQAKVDEKTKKPSDSK